MNSWVELNVGRLTMNISALRSTLPKSTEIVFVVKANAYGHDVSAVADCAWKSGVRWYAVAHVSEAEQLRKMLPDANIVVISAIDPARAPRCIQGGFIPVVVDRRHAAALSAAAEGRGVLHCHVKIDTGMGRLGIAWEDAAQDIGKVAGEKNLELSGVCTHFASSDGDSREFFDEQKQRFSTVLESLSAAGLDAGFRHASNSGAVLLEPAVDLDGVRPGILLYGYSRCGGAREVDTKPILSWKTKVLQVKRVKAGFPVSYDGTYRTDKETTLATIDVGYSDGYLRSLSNKGAVLINGSRIPVVGRVTMNLITADAGDMPVTEGDEVVLVGEQGGESIWADELASLAGTISYEMLTAIKPGRREVVQ